MLQFGALNAQTLSYETIQYMNTSQSSFDSWLSLNFLKELRLKKDVSGLVDIDLSLKESSSSKYNYNVPLAYITLNGTYKGYDSFRIHFGKKTIDWYAAEEFWGLSDLNTPVADSLFNTKQEGVVGVHFDSQLTDRLKFSFLSSFLHQPSLNPSYDTDAAGKIVTSAHWDRNKYPTRLVFQDEEYDIQYNIQDTAISDIVFQKSLGANLEYKMDKDAKLSTFFIIGPEHSLRKNINAYLNKSMDKVIIDVYPIVNQRLSYGLTYTDKLDSFNFDLGLKITDSNYSDSLFTSNPKKEFAGDNYVITPNYSNAAVLNLGLNKKRARYNISLNYIHALHSAVAGGIEQLDRWRKAIGLMGAYNFSNKLQASLNIKQDIELSDTILTHEYNYKLSKDMLLTLGLELIHSENKDSYWYNYRKNDTIYSLLTYDI